MKKKNYQKKANKSHASNLKKVNTVEDGKYSDFITMLILILEE